MNGYRHGVIVHGVESVFCFFVAVHGRRPRAAILTLNLTLNPIRPQSPVYPCHASRLGELDRIKPTNNHSEQQGAPVCDRPPAFLSGNGAQGTRSEVGQRYHQLKWTAIATCGKHRRSFFHFLHESVTAVLSGGKPPRLLSE